MVKKRIRNGLWAVLLIWCMALPAFAQQMLVPVGRVVGLSLAEGSVTVVAYDETWGQQARDSGLQIGDEILSVNGVSIDSAQALSQALASSQGEVCLTVARKGQTRDVTITPASTGAGRKLGVYLREGISGIGTVTYYDPDTGTFGALGHGISNSRGLLCAMRQGQVYAATVSGIRPGVPGTPGQLLGAVSGTHMLGTLAENTAFGIFGSCSAWAGEPLPVATAAEVTPGPARILANLSGDRVEEFQVEIVKVFDRPGTGRDLLIHVTDPALLEQTGGIVAGMSGSPILMDGKLIGAVTHVCVNL